ncbi:DUF262 domain-containing protein [Fusobacterium polymorphum]|uniref:DUF262 domain-containing protein n=1 Tax=Fusobacterium nucleatum subsp. polymorphum TaxID=76857 RepID=UPI003007F558
MSFQTPITIKGTLDKIQENKYLIPAIQREFVWKSMQIEKLFDSLINDYPIGSFLFWEVKEPKNYKFYEFIKKYDQRETNHNHEISLTDNREVIAILDGQQRLTALYIGLLGTYTEKLPYYRWDNPKAFSDKYLCLNLLDKNDDEIEEDTSKYEFKFCSKKEIEKRDNKNFWFKVGDILKLGSIYDITRKCIEIFKEYPDEIIKNASDKLSKLHNVIYNKPIINYYLEEENNLDKVLNIFLRVNSMGTKLNYSDLLLSIATAQWGEKRDAREEINNLVDELNRIGDGFDLDKDFVLKAALYLTKKIKNIRFKVDNFKKENMDLIEENWDNIANSLDITLKLLKSFGYNKDNLSAYTPVLPVALYILENNIDYKIINHSSFSEDRKLIKEWIIKSTLKGIFSGRDISANIREVVLKNESNNFPLDKIKEELKKIPGKSINFSEEEIDNLSWNEYGDNTIFSVLQLLYPNLDYRNNFHIDHIYPKSKFNEKYLKKQNIDVNDLWNPNYIANLQLLEGSQNLEKSNKEFKDWLEEQDFSEEERKDYFKKNYIPENIELTFKNYNEFFETREKLLLKQLKKILLEKE